MVDPRKQAVSSLVFFKATQVDPDGDEYTFAELVDCILAAILHAPSSGG